MRRIREWTVALALAAVVAGADLAGAKDEPQGPSPQPKADQPFVKAILGDWTWTSKTAKGETESGTCTFRLGLADTAVFEDLAGQAGGVSFEGHGVWKPSGDSLAAWWFFSTVADPMAFRGTLSAEGYDVKDETGQRMTLAKTETGLEMKAYRGDVLTRTVTFVRR